MLKTSNSKSQLPVATLLNLTCFSCNDSFVAKYRNIYCLFGKTRHKLAKQVTGDMAQGNSALILVNILADQTPEGSDVTAQEDQTEISPILFPAAIGALLVVMFGGLLFSSRAPFCKTKTMTDRKTKRKFEEKYGRRAIRFYNVPQKIAKEPCSVLQQENNDIVDAVKKEYQDLPQYQPVSGLVGKGVGLNGRTCAVNDCRPEVTERGASPIHVTRSSDSLDNRILLRIDNETDKMRQNIPKENKKSSVVFHNAGTTADEEIAQIPSASSGIGTNFSDIFEVDSLEEFPLAESEPEAIYDTIPECNGSSVPLHSACTPSVPPIIDRGVYIGGRSSVLRYACAPMCVCINACNCPVHGTNAAKVITSDHEDRTVRDRLTWGSIAQKENVQHLDLLRLNTPSADVSKPEMTERERVQSPLRREDLEKWLNEVKASREENNPFGEFTADASDFESENSLRDTIGVPGHRRISAPSHESLQLLKRQELISDNDRSQLAQTKPSLHRGGRASCMEIVRAPSSLCVCAGKCNNHDQDGITAGQLLVPSDSLGENSTIEDSNDTANGECHRCIPNRTEWIAKGGRWSCLRQVKASSDLCIHGPACQFHCQKAEKSESAQTARKSASRARNQPETNFQLRGASVFGGNDSIDLNIDYANSQQREIIKDDSERNAMRGASSFGYSTLEGTLETETRGASSFTLSLSKQLYSCHKNPKLSLASVPPKTLDIDHGQPNRSFPSVSLEQLLSKDQDFKEIDDIKTDFEEIRGASCFASLDESNAGTSSITLSVAEESDVDSFPGYKSSDQIKRDPTLNPLVCVKKTTAATRAYKTNYYTQDHNSNSEVEVNNNPSLRNQRDLKMHSKLPSQERKDVKRHSGAVTKKINEPPRDPAGGFDERILKVGKDAAMLSTLLDALTRDKEQRQQDTEHPCKRNNTEDMKNGTRTFAGNLKFSLFYRTNENSTPLLFVNVLGLEGISEKIISPLHSIYIKFCLTPKFSTWRRTKKMTISEKKLTFEDCFIISGLKPVDLDEGILKFIVVCVEGQERAIGELKFPLAGLRSRSKLRRTCAFQPLCAKKTGIEDRRRLEPNG